MNNRLKAIKVLLVFAVLISGFICFFNILVTSRSEEMDAPSEERAQSAPASAQRSTKPENDVRAAKDLQKRLKTVLDDQSRQETETASVYSESDVYKTKLSLMYSAIKNVYEERIWSTFEDILKEEQPDHEWTASVRDEIDKIMREGELNGTELLELGCYETMCQIVTQHGGMDNVRSFFQKTTNNEAIFGPSRARTSKQLDGSVMLTTYLAKYGNDEAIHEKPVERLYHEVTGRTFDSIEPTEEQILTVLAYEKNM